MAHFPFRLSRAILRELNLAQDVVRVLARLLEVQDSDASVVDVLRGLLEHLDTISTFAKRESVGNERFVAVEVFLDEVFTFHDDDSPTPKDSPFRRMLLG